MSRNRSHVAQVESSSAGIDPVAYRYDRPVTFYVLASAITWALWLVAGRLSHLPDQTATVRFLTAAAGLAGLAAPMVVAAILISRRPGLWADVRSRLLWKRGTSRWYLLLVFLLMPASLVAAQAISLLFGYSGDQFLLRTEPSFTSGLLPVWVILGLAPIVEEIAWHSYGTDTLITRMRLFWASLLFVVFWALWHLPLAMIKGYYQAELVEEGWLTALNFPVSMIAFVFLMNWLYYRTGRSIAAAIIFHFVANYANEIFRTDPDTKFIQTGLLLILTVVVVARNRELFFSRPARSQRREPAAPAPGPVPVNA